jgi:hypothetical protein
MLFTYRYNGPPDQGNYRANGGMKNNAIINSKMGMAQKFYPSANDSMFSNARKAYIKDAGGGTILSGNNDASQYIQLKKINATGKGSTLKSTVSFQGKSNDTTFRNSALARVRGGGTVAPKKKGAIENTFKSGGRSRLTGTGNRQVFA